MRSRPLVAFAALAAALVLASSALAVLSVGDKRAVKASLARAKTLQKRLQDLRNGAAQEVVFRQAPCRGEFTPSDTNGRTKVATLLGIETLRILQHNGFADYETFIRTQQKAKLADRRLRTAQRALAAELAAGRKLVALDILVCNDLRDFSKSGFSDGWLTQWAKRLDKQAGIDEAAAAKTDRLVRASGPALRAAGLSAANVKLLLDAETGDIFADVLSTS